MSGPIVYLDRSEIMPGRFDSVYVSGDRAEMAVIHVHRDAASFARHFQVAGPAFSGFVHLVRLKSIDVYRDLTDDLVEQLREKARLLGRATVSTHPFLAGFARLPAS